MTHPINDAVAEYSGRDIEAKKSWYSPAALNYQKARPGYPNEVIEAVVGATTLDTHARILEIGCGPGTATQAFAALGCAIDAVEPNPDFVKMARDALRAHAAVKFHNVAFEDFEPDANDYDVVLAASSLHWLSLEVAFDKSARALKSDGHLVLLWNKELQPGKDVFDRLEKFYAADAPDIQRYETLAQQLGVLSELGKLVTTSGYFAAPTLGYVRREARYSAEKYLALLSSYSPYLRLAAAKRARLFAAIESFIADELGGEIALSYVSAYHIAVKK